MTFYDMRSDHGNSFLLMTLLGTKYQKGLHIYMGGTNLNKPYTNIPKSASDLAFQ